MDLWKDFLIGKRVLLGRNNQNVSIIFLHKNDFCKEENSLIRQCVNRIEIIYFYTKFRTSLFL